MHTNQCVKAEVGNTEENNNKSKPHFETSQLKKSPPLVPPKTHEGELPDYCWRMRSGLMSQSHVRKHPFRLNETMAYAYYKPATATDTRFIFLFFSEYLIYWLPSRCKDNFSKYNNKNKKLQKYITYSHFNKLPWFWAGWIQWIINLHKHDKECVKLSCSHDTWPLKACYWLFKFLRKSVLGRQVVLNW